MRFLDHLYLRLARPLRCFDRGFGDEALLDRPLDPASLAVDPIPATLRWTRARAHGAMRILDGEFESPEALLPRESRIARVRMLAPRTGTASALAVALASWNDETFVARERMLAPVAERGIACLLLENPFYGARRRVGQAGARLGSVSDFVLMGRSAVREAHALMAWGRAEGFDRVGVVGYSMGGQMTAMTAALAPWPVHAVAMAPAVTAASVFLDGPLRRDVAEDALGPGGMARLRAVFSSLSVLALPPVKAPELATLVATRHDAIVPPEDAIAIARHWRIAPRWLDDGHVSAIALRSRALAQAIVDTFTR